jgi:hypothetical protein
VTGPSVKELARATDPMLRRLAGLVRRMAVGATAKILWQLTGVRGLDGKSPPIEVEVFSGLGIYARPATNGQPEAIVVNVGGAKLPVIVATRDAKSLQAMIGELDGKPAAGELVLFPPAGGAVIYCKADGTVEIRTPGGTASRLATLDDLQRERAWLIAHTHPGLGSPPSAPLPPAPVGTIVLKGE